MCWLESGNFVQFYLKSCTYTSTTAHGFCSCEFCLFCTLYNVSYRCISSSQLKCSFLNAFFALLAGYVQFLFHFFLLILLSDTKHNKYNFIPGTRQIKFNVCCANCSRLAKIDAILTHRERTNWSLLFFHSHDKCEFCQYFSIISVARWDDGDGKKKLNWNPFSEFR